MHSRRDILRTPGSGGPMLSGCASLTHGDSLPKEPQSPTDWETGDKSFATHGALNDLNNGGVSIPLRKEEQPRTPMTHDTHQARAQISWSEMKPRQKQHQRTMRFLLCTLLLLCVPNMSLAQEPSPTQGEEVHDPDPVAVAILLEERCARCHEPASGDKKAIDDWPDATDLSATLMIDLMVVPGGAIDSDLFLTCDDGDMPPEGEEEPPLSQDELDLLARWINNGASLPNPMTLERRRGEMAQAAAALSGAGNEKDSAAETQPKRHRGAKSWLAFGGRLHITLLHFPVTLLVLAGLLALKKGEPGVLLRASIAGAAPFACLASISGWILASELSGDMELHRWLGVACAVLSLGSWWATSKVWKFWRPIVFITCLVLISAAHGGGDLVHGEDWLRLPL